MNLLRKQRLGAVLRVAVSLGALKEEHKKKKENASDTLEDCVARILRVSNFEILVRNVFAPFI
jgi:hypothetical protein